MFAKLQQMAISQGAGAAGAPGTRAVGGAPPPGARLFQHLQGKGAPPGTVGFEEFQKLTAGAGMPAFVAKPIWEKVDTDKSGNLNEPEFMKFAALPGINTYIPKMEANLPAHPGGNPPYVPGGYGAPAGAPGSRLFAFMQGKSGAPPGQVSWTEFSQMTGKVGWPQEVAQKMWFDTDKDKSGVLDQREFLGFAATPGITEYITKMEANIPASAPAPAPVPAAAPAPVGPGSKLFNHMQGKSGAPPGQVSWTEFAKMTGAVGWPQEVAQKMWFDTDKDKSGVLDQGEFKGFAGTPGITEYITKMEAKLP